MKILTFHTTELETDTYLVTNGSEAFVVDPGDGADMLTAAAEAEGAKIGWVLLTHAHFDHIGAAAELQRGGALIVMHRDDVPLVGSFKNLAFYAGKKVSISLPTSRCPAAKRWTSRASRESHAHPWATPRAECATSRRTASSRATRSSSCPTAGRISRRGVSRSSRIRSSTNFSPSRGLQGFPRARRAHNAAV